MTSEVCVAFELSVDGIAILPMEDNFSFCSSALYIMFQSLLDLILAFGTSHGSWSWFSIADVRKFSRSVGLPISSNLSPTSSGNIPRLSTWKLKA